MSDPRIALVSEGTTDAVVIEAALKAILKRPFVLVPLQPEATRPEMGSGWGGVLKWCQEFRRLGAASLEADPTLQGFDLVIVHLDADVAEKSYSDCGTAVVQWAQEQAFPPLPCSFPCPPPSNTTDALEAVLLGWLGLSAVGPRSLVCLPSKAIESWLASAVLPSGHNLLTDLECNLSLETGLAQLPKGQKIRKSRRDYQRWAGKISSQWDSVKAFCSRAAVFEREVLSRSAGWLSHPSP